MTPILIIDDDVALCEMLAEYLSIEGFNATCVHDGESGLVQASEHEWSAVVLDVMLPGMSGFELLRRLRTQSKVPVLMLTARGEDTDTVVGLELGADDYVAKPANPRVLAARLRALVRRGGPEEEEETVDDGLLRVGDLTLDPGGRKVTLAGEPIELTGAEFKLLSMLLEEAGEVVSKERLAAEGLGRALLAHDRRVDTHISQIRRKLGDLPDGGPRICNLRGVGYQYVTG